MKEKESIKRIRKIVKRSITKEQFLAILSKAAQPIKKQSDSASVQTSKSPRIDDCDGKNTRLDRTEGI